MLVADVAVVGAGPAGTAAALTLARAGRDVVVLDRARFPRDKCCGDGLTASALRQLEELGLDPSSVASWHRVDDVVVRSPSGREITFPLPRDQGSYAVTAKRFDLDAAMVDLARAGGAKVLDGHAVVGAAETSDRVILEVEGVGAVHARYAVAADGMWSPMRKALGSPVAQPGYLGEWHAFRQYFAGVSDRAASELFVFFEPDLLPGYFWSFPLPGGRANVGFGILRDGGKVGRVQDMKGLWPDLLARPHVRSLLGPNARPDAPHKAWPIPARIDEVVVATKRTLFAGDAAAACDPMTGEGIGQALLTGTLAGEAIVSAGPEPGDAAARSFERAVRDSLVADHRMSVLLARALRHRKGARFAVALAGASRWTRGNFSRWLFEDYPRSVVTTPRRWHRGALSGPGAYRSSTPTRPSASR